MKKLPIGISTLRKIISGGYAYVDKSRFVHQLVEEGTYYLLSRPRRFGKSLFIDTLKEAFEGNQDLFRGLWLEGHWDWEKRHPVIHISFGGGVIKNRKELDRRIIDILFQYQKSLGMVCRETSDTAGCFGELIRNCSEKYGLRAVVLIDEYDKPILDNLSNTEVSSEVREGLKNLYSVIKDSDANIEFAFLTGVSKFSKVSLFSGLNNLTDITPAIEGIEASESIIGAFEVDFIEPENLLFQAGYLTISGQRRVAGKIFYTLRYPNMEVKASLSDYILNRYFPDPVLKEKAQLGIHEALQTNDLEALRGRFQSLFAAIPHDWYRKNNLAEYEGYYASIFYCYFVALGLDVTPEDSTSRGRIDMTVKMDGKVFIFEFKVVDIEKTTGTALEQIRRKKYAEKYRSENDGIYLVGMEFDRTERNIVRFEWETACENASS